MSPRIAFDVGPLVGPRSGIGVAVEHLLNALRAEVPPPALVPYVLSFRAPLPPATIRLRYPAALAHEAWSRGGRPRVDRPLGRPDVVHGTNYVVPPARAARLVTVYDVWFLEHPEGVHHDVARAGAVLRRAIADGAVVHSSSRATADALTSLFPEARVEVIPLGAVPLGPAPAAPSPLLAQLRGRPFVVSIGTHERRKNLPTLVRAFAEVGRAEPELDLILAGPAGNDTAAIASALGTLPSDLRRRVHLPGRVDDGDKAWLITNARMLAYPSLDEGFGFPLLEAMGVGTPVVASTAGSIPEVAGTAALLHPPADPDAIAAAVLHVHRDEAARAELAARGFENVTRFDWRTTAERMVALYASLAMERAR